MAHSGPTMSIPARTAVSASARISFDLPRAFVVAVPPINARLVPANRRTSSGGRLFRIPVKTGKPGPGDRADTIRGAAANVENMREAQPGVKYGGEEQVGSYDARRYDFDLANVPVSEKAATLMAGKWLGAVVGGATGNQAVLQDYNVKGSPGLLKTTAAW